MTTRFHFFVAPLVTTLWLIASTTANAGALAEDASRPQFETKDRHLREALVQRADRAVIVNFWAPWCGPCRAEMPSLQRLANRWRSRGVTVLTVNVADRAGDGPKLLWDIGVTLPVLHDPDQAISRTLGVRSLPVTLVLDRAHRVIARGDGVINWDARALDRQLEHLLK